MHKILKIVEEITNNESPKLLEFGLCM